MTAAEKHTGESPGGRSDLRAPSDTRLVRDCLQGKEGAWEALIARYERLIYSIPLKYGLSRDAAADIFQAICLELYAELANLRRPESLKAWLISVTTHKVFQWKTQEGRNVQLSGVDAAQVEPLAAPPAAMLEELEREQVVREAVEALPPRCVKLVRMLFYEFPPVSYADVARRLGLAVGTLGSLRNRCLKRLQSELEKRGL